MSESPLYQLIQQIEYGTHLHIGVLFFKHYGNAACELPNKHAVHAGPICNILKTASRNSFFRCVRCRNLALQKALTEKTAFGGLCVNGVYEYTHPVVIDNDVAAVIFIGNILDCEQGLAKLQNRLGQTPDAGIMQADFSPAQCCETAQTIDLYIRFLLEKYPNTPLPEKPIIHNIKRYVEDNLSFGADIQHIAAAFHYNPRYLCRLFKKETGTSLNDYVTQRRLKRACHLLTATTHTVMEISTEVGFNNVTYFNKLFKAAFGVTPTAYRQKQTSGE